MTKRSKNSSGRRYARGRQSAAAARWRRGRGRSEAVHHPSFPQILCTYFYFFPGARPPRQLPLGGGGLQPINIFSNDGNSLVVVQWYMCSLQWCIYFCPQQSPDAAVAASARPPIAQLGASWVWGSTISPKSRARASQMLARATSLSERPRGLCVVHRMKVVL